MPSPIELIIKHFSEHYKDRANELTVKLWLYLKQGYSLNHAVNQAMIDVGLLSYFHDEVKSTIADSAAKGAQIDKLPLLKPLTKAWDASGLTLSQKLHSADKNIINTVKNTIKAHMALNSGVTKTARALYDGYNHPTHVMMQQALPAYIEKIAQFVRRADLSLEERRLLLHLCRKTKAKTERLAQNGAPTKALKTAYNQLLEAVEQGKEHAMKRAVKTAVEEKSRYIAERIARTEAARAWQDGFLARYENNERVIAYKWHLSSRHPVFDICDMYAKADLYNLGKGIFPKDKVPKIPVHPHCMCYLSPVYKSELKDKTERDQTKEEGDKWLKSLPPLELYKVMGAKGIEAWGKGEDWRKYARNYFSKQAVSRISNDINDLSGRGTKKIFITERTIQRLALFKYPNKTDEENAILRELQKKLLTFSMKENNSNEVALVVSRDLRSYEIQKGSEVDLDFSGKAAVKIQTERHLYVLHNHPKGSTYSLTDLIFFIRTDTVDGLGIITNSGRIEILIKDISYDKIKAENILYDYLKKDFDNYKAKKIDKNQYFSIIDRKIFGLLNKFIIKGIFLWKK